MSIHEPLGLKTWLFDLIIAIVFAALVMVALGFNPFTSNESVEVEPEPSAEVNDTFAPTIYTIPDQCDLAVVDCK